MEKSFSGQICFWLTLNICLLLALAMHQLILNTTWIAVDGSDLLSRHVYTAYLDSFRGCAGAYLTFWQEARKVHPGTGCEANCSRFQFVLWWESLLGLQIEVVCAPAHANRLTISNWPAMQSSAEDKSAHTQPSDVLSCFVAKASCCKFSRPHRPPRRDAVQYL